MDNLLKKIDEVLLMGPGPSCVHPEVYKALSKPTLGHLDPYFIKIMDGIKELQQDLMNTKNSLTIPASGTGSAGMETCFVNLIEAGDPVLVLVNGVFGTRMVDVAERLGADVDRLDFEWGTPVTVDQVKSQLAKKSYKIVAMVHAETSTGVLNPAEEIGKLLKGTDALYLLDAVTSLGGIDVRVDDWGVDAIYSGTQKCLSCPPGLSPVSFSDRAFDKIKNRTKKVPNWYLDVSMIAGYWEGQKRAYHHTAPINMLYGLYESLYQISKEGKQQVFSRHAEMHRKLVTGLNSLGIQMLVEEPYRLPMLNSIHIPASIKDEAAARNRLRDEFFIEIGAGLGPLAGKIWRIGLMGHTAREENVERLVKALKAIM